MRVWLSVDMEGVGGIVDRDQLLPEGLNYERARGYMLEEMRIVVQTAWSEGAEEVVIADSHDGAINLRWDELDGLDDRTVLISGIRRPLLMAEGLVGMDSALLIGYHAMAGTSAAVMDHTYTGDLYSVHFNGREVGEAGINAYLAGHFGVPVLLATGDQALATEVQALIPRVESVITKEALGRRSARLPAPAAVRDKLRQATVRCLGHLRAGSAPDPLKIEMPVSVEVGFMTTDAADSAMMVPESERITGRSVRVIRPDMPEAFRAFRALMSLGAGAPLY
jgi:D-amino peptidase